jgi:hypothetical protein
MQEKDLVRTIEKLRTIEPRKDWVLSVKTRVFAEYDFENEKPHKVWNFFMKPAAVIPLVAFAVVGLVFYLSAFQELQTTKLEVNQLTANLQEIQKLTLSLEGLQTDIRKTKDALDAAEISNPKTVLKMSEGIEKATMAGRKIVEAASSSNTESGENLSILASITNTKKAIEDLENSNQENNKKMVDFWINEIDHWALGEEEFQIFQEAKQDYEQGRYFESLEKIVYILVKNKIVF